MTVTDNNEIAAIVKDATGKESQWIDACLTDAKYTDGHRYHDADIANEARAAVARAKTTNAAILRYTQKLFGILCPAEVHPIGNYAYVKGGFEAISIDIVRDDNLRFNVFFHLCPAYDTKAKMDNNTVTGLTGDDVKVVSVNTYEQVIGFNEKWVGHTDTMDEPVVWTMDGLDGEYTVNEWNDIKLRILDLNRKTESLVRCFKKALKMRLTKIRRSLEKDGKGFGDIGKYLEVLCG